MLARLRRAFNASYTDDRYRAYAAALVASLGCEVGFRLAETPVFLDAELKMRCETAAREIVAQLEDPSRRAAMAAAIPDAYAADDGTDRPQFAVVDFAIARARDGTLEPRLVELQGFPSLLAFQVLQSDAWLAHLAAIEGVDRELSPYFSGLDRASFLALLHATIVGDADPAETVLLDVAPREQKTYCDFAATERLCGIVACDPRELYVRERRVYRREAAGRERRVARIYNRLVGDDLASGAAALPFDVRDDVDVTWAPHPRWFWQWSKASLPHLTHAAVPTTMLVSEVANVPSDVGERYVLKPLFSFAGAGVNVCPSAGDVAAIAPAERTRWCLQEKIAYAPALTTPEGDGVNVELRVMLLRPDAAAALRPATNLCRLSRGAMIGVDYNRDRTWVGSSVALG